MSGRPQEQMAMVDAVVKELRQAIPRIDIDAHNADKERRQKRRDEMRQEHIKCLDGRYAAMREMEKPVYEWTVTAEWMGKRTNGQLGSFSSKQKVVAQTANDAWAAFCTKIQRFPSRRDANVKIKQGKQVESTRLVAALDDLEATVPAEVVGVYEEPPQRL